MRGTIYERGTGNLLYAFLNQKVVIKMFQNRDKLKANAVAVCERLGKYRQAFAWTGIYLMNVINGGNSLERDSDRDSFSSSSTTNSLGIYFFIQQ